MSNPLPLDATARAALRAKAEKAQAAWERYRRSTTTTDANLSWEAHEELADEATPDVILALLAAVERGAEDTARVEWLEKHANPVHAAVLSFPAKVRDGATGRSFEADSIREAVDAARSATPTGADDAE